MFGIYRLILACMVALSHFGLVIAGFNPGQWAVLSFYVLSGFLMEKQFHKLGKTSAFYMDRLLRIYPLFAVVLAGAYFLFHPTLGEMLQNVLLFPLNYATLTGIPVLISPTWSLACEAHFYLLIPLLARFSTRVIRLLIMLSALLFAISPFLPLSTFWAFTALPGILFTFLSGMLIARQDFRTIKILWICFAVILSSCLCTKIFHTGLLTGIHINVCIGFLMAHPLVSLLSRYSPKNFWDQTMGLLSYPLFLVHEPIHIFMNQIWPHTSMPLLLLSAIIASIFLALLIEKPLDVIRYKIRRNMAQ